MSLFLFLIGYEFLPHLASFPQEYKNYNYKSNQAIIYSQQSNRVKKIINELKEKTIFLTSDEIGIIGYLMDLEREIRKYEERAGKTAGKIVKFPTVANLGTVEK